MSEEKAYTLREMTADDVFPMVKIISGIGLKEFKAAFEAEDVKAAIAAMTGGEAEGEKPDAAAIGITIAVNIANVIFSNLPKCKADIYKLLSGLSGMAVKDIAALPMPVFMNMVVDTIRKEEFRDFFGAAARLFK